MTRVDVVTHVHWDREWYRTFDGFRARLVELVDAVLDQLEDGRLTTFLLDGQTSIVDDYLEVRPDQRDRLAGHVAAGRLRVGPWYVLADKTLVSGEALVRNLLVGAAAARSWGGRTDVGYCPDMFGHPPELPMVLRGFGIDTALVWRGADPAIPAFRWRAPDGTEVTAVRSRYYEPEILWQPDGAADRLHAWIEERRAEVPDGPWLLLNGGDHLAPRDLDRTLAALDAPREPDGRPGLDVEVRSCTLEDHLADLRDRELPVVDGALRRPGVAGAFLLAGTRSTRARGKRRNADAQALLEHHVEPLVAQALRTPEPRGAAQELPTDATLRGLLDRAWHHLLLAQPHDSVCGCGTDQVAADTLRRLDAAVEVGEQVLARAASRLGLPAGPAAEPDPDGVWLAVRNGAGHRRDVLAAAVVEPPHDRGPVRVVDHLGRDVPFVAVPGEVREDLATDIATLPGWPRVCRHDLQLAMADVPAAGWRAVRVEFGPPDAVPTWQDDDGDEIAGGRLRAGVAPDGTLWLADTVTGTVAQGLCRVVDTGERGDTYNHDAPRVDRAVVATPVRVWRRCSAVGQELHVELAADLPTALTDDRDARRADTTPLRLHLVAGLASEADHLDVTLDLVTEARDHRLRLHLPAPTSAATFVTDSGFTWQSHPVPDGPSPLPAGPGEEADPDTQVTQRFAAVGDGAQRLAVLLHGQHEVAATTGPAGTELAVTLLRAVGQLGRHDLRTRTMGAGPPVPTPDAQERGAHRARLAVRLGDDDRSLVDAAWAWRAGVRTLALRGRPRVPVVAGVEVRGAQLSAWKPAHDGDGWVVRVANASPAPATATVHLPATADVRACRLDESPVTGAVRQRTATVGTALPPGGTASWRVWPDPLPN